MKDNNEMRYTGAMDINEVTLKQVSHVYAGKVGCMCGCLGKYHYTQAGMDALADDDYRKSMTERLDDRKVLRVLRTVQAAALDGKSAVEYDEGGEWVSVDLGRKRYCVYLLTEVK